MLKYLLLDLFVTNSVRNHTFCLIIELLSQRTLRENSSSTLAGTVYVLLHTFLIDTHKTEIKSDLSQPDQFIRETHLDRKSNLT